MARLTASSTPFSTIPTLSEAYKVAALDVTNKIRALDAVHPGAAGR